MRILLTLHHDRLEESGVGRVTRELAAAFARAGHEVDQYSFEDLPAFLSGKGRWVAFPWAVARFLRDKARRYDVVDASTGDLWVHGGLRGRRGARAPGPLLVTRSHGLETVNHAALVTAGALERGSLPGRAYHHHYRLWEVARSVGVSDAVLLLNDTERAEAVTRFGVPPDRAVVVDHGLGGHMLDLAPPAEDRAPLGLAFLGVHGPLKGGPTALAAMVELLAENPGRHATLLGTRVPPDAVLDGIPADVRERVRVVPRFENRDLPALLAGHHVLFAPALGEGFGLGVLEAMAAGLAPIVGAAPGPGRFVRDGDNGCVLDRPTAADLAEMARGLDGDRARLLALRRAAQATAQRYSWDATAGRQLSLYRRWLDERTGRSGSLD